jgi:hypothetical protein
MKVQIFSMMAAIAGDRDVVWAGDVTLDSEPLMGDEVSESAMLELLYRFFNRVDPGDGLKLESVGYRLPSLSVGDYIAFGGKCWQVEGVGFTQVTNNERYIMEQFR